MSILPPSPFITSPQEGPREVPLAAPPNNETAGGLFDPLDFNAIPLDQLVDCGFDEGGFLDDCRPLPAFLSAPSEEYLSATDLIPVLQVLAGR